MFKKIDGTVDKNAFKIIDDSVDIIQIVLAGSAGAQHMPVVGAVETSCIRMILLSLQHADKGFTALSDTST